MFSRMHAPVDVWRSVRSLPDFWRLQVRVASRFGDGLFQAGLAERCCWPDRAADGHRGAFRGAVSALFAAGARRGLMASGIGGGCWLALTPAG